MRLQPPRILVEVLVGIALLLALLSVALVWRIAQGPIAVDFAAPHLARLLAERFPGLSLELGEGAEIGWEDGVGLTVAARGGVLALGPQRLMVARAGLTFASRDLMDGDTTPRRVRLDGVDLTIVREADGRWPTPPLGGTESGAPRAATDLLITRLNLTVEDRALGIVHRLADARVAARVTAEDWRAEVTGRVGVTDVAADLDAILTATGPAVTVIGALTPTATPVAALVALARRLGAPTPAPLDGAAGTLSGRIALQATLGPTPMLERVEASIEVDQPRIALAQAGWIAGDRLSIGATLIGDRVDLAGNLAAASLGHPDLAPEPVDGLDIAASVTFDPSAPQRVTGRMKVTGDGLDLTAEAAADAIDGPVAIDLTLGEMPIDRLSRHWPAKLAPNPRRWVLQNMTGGRIVGASLALRLADPFAPDGPALDKLDGTMEVRGVRLTYAARLPPVEQAAARARFDMRGWDIQVTAGALRRLRVEQGRVRLTGIDGTDHRADVDLRVAGPLEDALAVLDTPPLGYAGRFGLRPAAARGSVQARLGFKFALLDRLTFADIDLSAEADLRGVALPDIVQGRALTDGQLKLVLTGNGMTIDGRANLDGVPFAAAWTEDFRDRPRLRRRIEAGFAVAPAVLARVGLDAGDAFDGEARLRATYEETPDRRARAIATADLTPARLNLPAAGFAKPVGAAADARVELSLVDGTPTSIDQLRITAPGLSAGGRARLGTDGRLERLDLDRLRIGPNDLSIAAARRGPGWLVSLVGARLDLRRWLESLDVADDDPPDAPPGPPLTIDLAVEELQLLSGEPFRRLRGRIDWDGAQVERLRATAMAGDGQLELVMAARADRSTEITARAGDAGGLLAAIGVTSSVRGGAMELRAVRSGTGAAERIEGRIEATDARVVGAPLLTRLLQLTSVTGILEALGGEGLLFDSASAEFSRTRSLFELRDGRAGGLAVGVSLRGQLDRRTDRLDFAGTLIPLNTVNRVLGAIPLIGDLLTGGGQGLIAFSFAMTGPSDTPEVAVNPLSVLTPGFLRRLFERDPGAPPRVFTPSPTAPR